MPSVAAAAAEWTLQSPLPTSADLRGVSMVGVTEAWAVGSGGEILHTADGGVTWDRQLSGTPDPFNAVCFLDAQTGWAVGTRFARTTDGGVTWSLSALVATTYGVDFVDAQRGWAVGNGALAYRTTDGGVTWTFAATDGGFTLKDVDFVDANSGWAVGGGGRIFRSTNGGQTWTPQTSNSSAWLDGVCFVSAVEGFVVGWGQLLHTTNAGATWQLVGDVAGVVLSDVVFLDSQRGWAIGQNQTVLRTTNGGVSWSQQALGDIQYLESIGMADASRGMAVGPGGHIYTTTDGGATWRSRRNGTTSGTHQLDALDQWNVWAANNGEVMRTTDGGAVWSVLPRGTFTAFAEGIDFLDPSRGWTVHSDDRVFRTIDGGATWSSALVTTENSIALEDIDALDAQTLVVVGGENVLLTSRIYRSIDGGATWSSRPHPAVNWTYYAADFANATTGWAAGNFASIVKTTDAGLTWFTVRNGGAFESLSDIDFADAMHGWAVGPAGLVVHTSDGGQTWDTRWIFPDGLEENLISVSALSPTDAWISGTGRYAARTTDGGATWIADDTTAFPGQGSFPAIDFVSAEHGWAGYSTGYPFGQVYRRSGAGATAVVDAWSAPVARAWPNPTRSGASFRIAAAVPGEPVALQVFDLAGRLVRRTATFGAGAPGAIRWDGRDAAGRAVAPGVYFFRVQSGTAAGEGRLTVIR